MKKSDILFRIGCIAFFALSVTCLKAQSQNLYSGNWEGSFLGDFRAVLQLTAQGNDGYSGHIRMYDGEHLIQDDELSGISISNNHIVFTIEAKQSDFEGSFNEEQSELTGYFIFPDQSQHPIILMKGKKSFEDTAARRLPAEGLIDDLNFLLEKLKENHPQLSHYTSESTFEQSFKSVQDQIIADLTIEEFYKIAAPLMEQVGCSHTGMKLPEKYQQVVFNQGDFLPVNLVCIDNRAYYLSDFTGVESDVLAGTEILRINDVPISDIIGQIFSMIPSEGGCVTTKYNEINHNFHKYFYLSDHSDTFEVEFQTGDGIKRHSYQSCGFGAVSEARASGGALPDVHFSVDRTNDVGFVTIPSFAIRDMEGYMHTLDSLFQELHTLKTGHLVIDLRDNQGGHPIFAAQLFSYLTPNEFTYFKRNPEAEAFEPLYNPMQPDQRSYDGNLIVLVNGGCLSTTGHLISLLKYHTEAIFIGEEPGSTFSCNDFSIQFTLPNTGMEVNIPRTTFETAVSGIAEGKPFPLDYRVEPTLSDIINGTDTYITFVYHTLESTADPVPGG